MIRLLFLVTGIIVLSQSSHAIEFNKYHNLKFIQKYLTEVAERYDHISYKYLGRSVMGREIGLLEMTKSKSRNAPVIYINCTHHGNEQSATEAALGIIDYFARFHDRPNINRFLKRYRILIHPVVNPDGFVKGSRFAVGGIDPNRDYPHPRNNEGTFRLPETRLVSKVLAENRVVGSLTLHSGIEAILWPWCFSDKKSPHEWEFKTIGRAVAETMGIKLFIQSYHDYQSEGEYIDYAYMKYGTYALTVEVDGVPKAKAEKLPEIVRKSVAGTIAFIQSLDQILLRNEVPKRKEISTAH